MKKIISEFILEEALEENVGIALSCTRWKNQPHHEFDVEQYKQEGFDCLCTINDPFYLIELIHSIMITVSKPIVVTNCREDFAKLGLEYYKEQLTSIFGIYDDQQYIYIDKILKLVEKIYNYFTVDYTENENKLKSEFLKQFQKDISSDLQRTMRNLRKVYDFYTYEDIYYLMQIICNKEDRFIHIKGLTAENDWKHIILTHYNFEIY